MACIYLYYGSITWKNAAGTSNCRQQRTKETQNVLYEVRGCPFLWCSPTVERVHEPSPTSSSSAIGDTWGEPLRDPSPSLNAKERQRKCQWLWILQALGAACAVACQSSELGVLWEQGIKLTVVMWELRWHKAPSIKVIGALWHLYLLFLNAQTFACEKLKKMQIHSVTCFCKYQGIKTRVWDIFKLGSQHNWLLTDSIKVGQRTAKEHQFRDSPVSLITGAWGKYLTWSISVCKALLGGDSAGANVLMTEFQKHGELRIC